ncbi:HEAT repeat domain-containing protein [Candidatus Micrarchaeota archaeon]|nr:HEAT repeat domain-containing protein [Candidatus Micrarchaeota archaeon]
METNDIEKWFKLTYDEDPKVRLRAAKELAKYPDSPLSIFALFELSYDKDEKVKEFAVRTLKELKLRSNGDEDNKYSLSNLLAHEKGETDHDRELIERRAEKIKEQLMPAIESYYFQNLSKEEVERVKSMVMPSLEKLFERLAVLELTGDREQAERLRKFVTGQEKGTDRVEGKGSEKESGEPKPSVGDKSTLPDRRSQPTLFELVEEDEDQLPEEYKEYLDVMSQIERIVPISPSKKSVTPPQVHPHPSPSRNKNLSEDPVMDYLIGQAMTVYSLPQTSPSMVKREMKRLIKEMELKVKSAFDIAKHKFKHREIKSLADLKDGMSNVYTGDLKVTLVEDKSFKLNKRTVHRIRLEVEDQYGNTFPVYLKGSKGRGIYEGDTIRFEGASVQTFPATGETVLVIDKKGKVVLTR